MENLDFTIQKEINLLGFSGNRLALIIDSLASLNYKGSISILKNIEVEDDVPYNIGYDIRILNSSEIHNKELNHALICVGKSSVKSKIFDHFLENNKLKREQYINLIHPESYISRSSRIDKGVFIEPNVSVSAFAEIGFSSTIGRNSSIGHHTKIGDFSVINPGVTISGQCQLGKEITIGAGTVVFEKIQIGHGSIIGGGSVVTKNIPAGVVAFGNPCKVVKSI